MFELRGKQYQLQLWQKVESISKKASSLFLYSHPKDRLFKTSQAKDDQDSRTSTFSISVSREHFRTKKTAAVCLSIPKKDRKTYPSVREGEPVNTNAYYYAAHSFPALPLHLSFVFSLTHKHRHTVQCLRAGQGARPDYSRWALCSWGLAPRWEEGEDKQTVCLLSDYSMCVWACVYAWVFLALPVVTYSCSVYKPEIIPQ